jgi:Protein of unknown function (DUF4058)
MPMHDWTIVPDGIFHAFHHGWISALAQRLNTGLLPDDLYALPEQVAAGFCPDVLTLQSDPPEETGDIDDGGVATALRTRPTTRYMSESEIYHRKKNVIAIRHVSGDGIVAVIEIVSPGNKAGAHPLDSFLRKVYDYLEHGVHLLILDPFPPGPRDPNGVHALIWQTYHSQPFVLPPEKPLTLVAYESDMLTRAYIEPLAVGDMVPDMPLFLAPNGCVMVPLEATYRAAFDVQPRRWRRVLEPERTTD